MPTSKSIPREPKCSRYCSIKLLKMGNCHLVFDIGRLSFITYSCSGLPSCPKECVSTRGDLGSLEVILLVTPGGGGDRGGILLASSDLISTIRDGPKCEK